MPSPTHCSWTRTYYSIVHMGHRGGGGQPVPHHVALKQELTNHRGQHVEADVCGFSLPGFRLGKSELALAQGMDELVAPLDLPHLAFLARFYRGVEATRCQAERNFSSLSVLIDTSRVSMSPFQVEQMMFLKLIQGCLPEVQKYNAVIAAQQERRSQSVQDVQSAQQAAARRVGTKRRIHTHKVEGMGDVAVREESCC